VSGVFGATPEGVVLRYAAFDTVPVRARSWVIWRWLWDLTCWVTAHSAPSLYFGIRSQPRFWAWCIPLYF